MTELSVLRTNAPVLVMDEGILFCFIGRDGPCAGIWSTLVPRRRL